MKKWISALSVALLTSVPIFAQRASPDIFQTDSGPLTIQPVLHATMVLTWNGKSIYVDPSAPTALFEGLPAPDMVVITDIHGDHMNVDVLHSLKCSNVTMVVPQAVADKLPDDLKAHLVIIGNGDSTQQLGVKIKAIPMYNLPEAPDAPHTKGRGNGYVLTIGGRRIYISGDTEDIPEMRRLKKIDVAFVCMNLPYTMDINQAASAVLDFKPVIVYPYHYRGANGLSDVAAFKKMVNDKNPSIEVRLRNWYPN